ncbi:uncharacterized protein LOC131215616 [Anopheles bellator]|uniref:uncharacterized protein LOC131215616 n=1 Tax=Anopheles bellator TaxID=139047 RepID=UPI002647107F|nr:uncharacterized protein LOC131215616 [Anopheles bellator]
MFKILCLLAVIAAVAAMPHAAEQVSDSAEASPSLVEARESKVAGLLAGEQNLNADEDAGDMAQDDMDRAESFGYGYRRIIHVYPGYYSHYHHYPRYFYHYPRHYYSHYGHYW